MGPTSNEMIPSHPSSKHFTRKLGRHELSYRRNTQSVIFLDIYPNTSQIWICYTLPITRHPKWFLLLIQTYQIMDNTSNTHTTLGVLRVALTSQILLLTLVLHAFCIPYSQIVIETCLTADCSIPFTSKGNCWRLRYIDSPYQTSNTCNTVSYRSSLHHKVISIRFLWMDSCIWNVESLYSYKHNIMEDLIHTLFRS